MRFTLEQIVPWGRTYEEYIAMFDLTRTDLQGRILGCGDGPAAFNAGLTRQGGRVVSVDPLYRFTVDDIRRRIEETAPCVMEQTRQNLHEFVWTKIKTVDELGRIRMSAMEEFLLDFQNGLEAGRYVAGELPCLPFADAAFDLAVCSHLLFLYSAQWSATFHLESIRELGRVAAEVRIFPLLELGAIPSRHLQAVVSALTAEGYHVEPRRVPYEFQRGGDHMLRIRNPS